MSQIEPIRSRKLAGGLFDEVMVPLALARQQREGQTYFPLHRDQDSCSYFVEPSLRAMEAPDFQPHRGDAEGLVAAVTSLWEAEGERDLADLGARMMEIAEALAIESTDSDGTVDVLCYTLF